jgi:RNA polymerase sigma-70 factor, ECF subfamily
MTIQRSSTTADSQLNERLRSGDKNALAQILEAFGQPARRRLRMQLGEHMNDHDLDDVMSIALYRLWTYRFSYDPSKGSMAHWLYLIARSAAFDLLRRKPEARLLTPERWRARAASDSSAEPLLPERLATVRRVQEALEQLSDVDRRIVMAFANTEGQMHWTAEIARELAMPPSTIRSRKHRAMARLRDILSPRRTAKQP